MAFVGIFTAFIFIPIMPEMVEATQDKLSTKHTKVFDICSGIFNVCFGCGTFLGPQLATIYMNMFGFPRTTEIFPLQAYAYGTIYFVFNAYPCFFRK